jgi:hypothetical protein
MITIRYNLFETNSSSASIFFIKAFQIEGLDIPSILQIDLADSKAPSTEVYRWTDEKDRPKFFGFLHSIGVKEIYVNGTLINELEECRHPNDFISWFDEESLPAYLFGDYFTAHEIYSWGGDLDDGPDDWIKDSDIQKVKRYIKDPNYKVVIYNEDDDEITFDQFYKQFTEQYGYRIKIDFTLTIPFTVSDTEMDDFKKKMPNLCKRIIIDEEFRKFIYDKGYPMYNIEALDFSLDNTVLTITGRISASEKQDLLKTLLYRSDRFYKFFGYSVLDIQLK